MTVTWPTRPSAPVRNPAWRLPPVRIDMSSCITCDACVARCPDRFSAVVARDADVVIVPERCSGCRRCVEVCPVDSIHPDPYWPPT